MSTQTNVSTLEQLGQQFTSLFKRRVFRLETLDYYDAENEREPYTRFLAGEPVDPAWRDPWKRTVRDIRTSGRTMRRVKIVTEPVSDYVRFSLLHASPASAEAGEDIRVLGRKRANDEWLAFYDYWLFDDDLGAYLIYDEAGRVTRVEMVRDGATLAWMREERDATLALATPLAKYVAEHNINERKHAA